MKSIHFFKGEVRIGGMKVLFIILLCVLLSGSLQGRLRFTGPNPYFSFRSFPQDSLKFTSFSSLFFLYYESRGWMGNLDMPEISPSPSYIATEESMQLNFPGLTNASAGFQGTWQSPSFLAAPVVIDLDSVRIIPLVTGRFDIFELQASGKAVYEQGQGYGLIPFSSELTQQNKDLAFGLVLSSSIAELPLGIFIKYTQTAEGTPSGFLQYTKNGQEIRLNRYNWGWSTVHGCNHIFGDPTTIDAFWQDDYNHTDRYKFDLVLGLDIKENKIGLRFRREKAQSDYFMYSSPKNSYVKNDWAERMIKNSYRAFQVLKIMNVGEAGLFLTGLIEADFIRTRYSWQDVELLDSYTETIYAAEILPFLHIDLFGGGFFRIGTSASVYWNDYSYKEIWGSQEVYSPGWYYLSWEPYWERSSYGRSLSFINFSEMDLELVLTQKKNLILSIDLWSHLVWRKTKRFYGKNEYDGRVYQFQETARRTNTLRETWIGGTFGLLFGKKFTWGVYADLPIYYDQFITTKINGHGNSFFGGESDAQPAVRMPVRFWAMVVLRWK